RNGTRLRKWRHICQCRRLSFSRYAPPWTFDPTAPRFRRSKFALLRAEKIRGYVATRRRLRSRTGSAPRHRTRCARILRGTLSRGADETRDRTYRWPFESGILVATRPQMGITQNDSIRRTASDSRRLTRRFRHSLWRPVCRNFECSAVLGVHRRWFANRNFQANDRA